MKGIYTFFSILLIAGAANADPVLKSYVGADYNLVHLDYQNDTSGDGANNLSGIDIHAGERFSKYFGVEGSYLWTADGNKSNVHGTGINTSENISGVAFDVMGYLPVSDKIELISTAGVTRLREHTEASGAVVGSGTEWETNGRIGAGAQYWLSDSVNTRALVRYQGADFSGDLNDAVIASIGLNYQF